MVISTEEAVDPGASGTEGFRRYFQRLSAYFYADDILLTSTQVPRIQQVFATLTELFHHVGLRKNVTKTVRVSCRPFRRLKGHFAGAYGLRMARVGGTPTKSGSTAPSAMFNWRWVPWTPIGRPSTGWSGEIGGTPPPPPPPHPPDDTRNYGVSLPWTSRKISCLVGVFPERALSQSALQVHLVRRHLQDMLEVL